MSRKGWKLLGIREDDMGHIWVMCKLYFTERHDMFMVILSSQSCTCLSVGSKNTFVCRLCGFSVAADTGLIAWENKGVPRSIASVTNMYSIFAFWPGSPSSCVIWKLHFARYV